MKRVSIQSLSPFLAAFLVLVGCDDTPPKVEPDAELGADELSELDTDLDSDESDDMTESSELEDQPQPDVDTDAPDPSPDQPDDEVDQDFGDLADVPDVPDEEELVDPCAPPAAADSLRRVVLSHPYAPGEPAGRLYEVLELSADGKLSRPQQFFEMERALWGEIHFTPNGRIGVVVQDRGTLGVFRFEDDHSVAVVHDGFSEDFYAGSVVLLSQHELLIVDENWAENGGGIFSAYLGCDGSISDVRKLASTKLARGLQPLANGDFVVAARDFEGQAPAGSDALLLSLGGSPALLGSVDAFGDDDAIVSSTALTKDGQYFLLADNSAFSGIDNRVAVVRVDDTSLSAVQVLGPFVDPAALLCSPFNNAALVLAAEDDAIYALDYDPALSPPFTLRGELSYLGGKPLLPTSAAMIARGPLEGRVLVAENVALRQLQFHPDGSVEDLGAFSFGEGLEAITGVVGVQP
ncbi:MAG: hypothetical protein RBU37_12915 [Myxococcota bacterium]|jgi:hypothetical protein|nr:hypothetical protein [Myxococcota bacterium]